MLLLTGGVSGAEIHQCGSSLFIMLRSRVWISGKIESRSWKCSSHCCHWYKHEPWQGLWLYMWKRWKSWDIWWICKRSHSCVT